jgi:hypothetical protein
MALSRDVKECISENENRLHFGMLVSRGPPTPRNRNHGSAMRGSVLRGRGKRKLTTVQNLKEAMRWMISQRAGVPRSTAEVIKQDAGTPALAHRDYDKNLSTSKK